MSFFPPNRLFILPTSLAAARERDRLLDETPDGVILSPKIFTFGRLEQTLDKELQEVEPLIPVISDTGQIMLLALLVEDAADELKWPIDLRRGPGLLARLKDLIDQMRLSGVSAAQFADVVDNGIDDTKAAKLAFIASRYEEALAERGVTDRVGRRRMVLDALTNAWIPRLFKGVSEITLIRFNRFTPFQINLLKEFPRFVDRIRVQMVYPEWIIHENLEADSGGKWNPFRGTLAEIRSIEASGDLSRGLELSPPRTKQTEHRTPALTWIENNLFRPYPAYDAPAMGESLEIVAAPGRYGEVEEIGRRIFDLLEQGAEPDRIVVAVRDLGIYGQLVEDVFRRFRLPCYFRRGAPLEIQPPARTLLSVLRLARSNWDRDDVLDILASPYLDTNVSLHWDRVAFLSAEAGVTDDRAGGGWQANLDRLSRGQPEYAGEIEDILSGLRKLRELLAPFEEPMTWSVFKKQSLFVMERLGLSGRLEDGLDSPFGRDGHSWTAIIEVFDALEESADWLGLSSKPFEPDVLLHWLSAELHSRNIGQSGSSGRGIMVLNVHDLHGLTYDHVFIAGLNEGEFPQLRADNPLLPDDLILALNKSFGRSVFQPAGLDYGQQALLFYHALASAKRQAVLSYSRVDNQGRIRIRSPLIEEILRLWPKDSVRITEPPPAHLNGYRTVLTVQELFGTLAADLVGKRIRESSRLGPCLVGLMESRYSRQFEIWEQIKSRATLADAMTEEGDEPSVRISESVLKGWLNNLAPYRGGPLLSPTLFQRYADCPFAFWAEEILSLGRLEETGDEIHPKREGSICHAVLSRFLRQCRQKGMLPLRGDPSEQTLLKSTLEEICSSEEQRQTLGRAPLWRIRKQTLLRILRRWLDREVSNADECIPAHFEWVFGAMDESKGAPPLCIELSDGGVICFRGRIDRIDLAEERARVLDYKTGGNRNKYQKLLKEEEIGVSSFQAPIYQCAVARAFNLPTEAGWVLLKDRSASRLKYSPSTDDDLFASDVETRKIMAEAGRPNFYNRLESVWRKIRQGNFAPRFDDAQCDFCLFKISCRVAGPGESENV